MKEGGVPLTGQYSRRSPPFCSLRRVAGANFVPALVRPIEGEPSPVSAQR